ncbi:TPA: phosphomannomutase CpsG, partial [Salmonella enterica subsp. diarizonae serovar 60-67:z35:-]
AVDRTDGISMSFADWRFNLRSSNTEPVVRLNVETKKNNELLNKQTAFVISLLRNKNNDTK